MVNEQLSRLYHLAWNYSEFDVEYQEKPTYERRCVVQSRIFAELIVAECISLCKVETTAIDLPEYNLGMQEGYRRARENISIYFGVEE